MFVGGVGEGIREAHLQAMTYTFFDVGLKRVIGGNARGSVRLGFRRIANVGNSQVDVASFVVRHHGSSIRKAQESTTRRGSACIASGCIRAGARIQSGIATRRREHVVAVGVILPVDWMAG